MATRNFTVSGDSTVTNGGGYSGQNLNRGAADVVYGGTVADYYLGVGKTGAGPIAGGALFRSLLKFNLDWTGVTSITSAVLYIRSSAPWHGASPDQIIKRITSTWTETGVTWNNQPTTTATGQVTTSMGGAFYTWYTADITAIVTAWAPATIPGGGAATNYGILLIGNGEASISDSAVFSDRESAYDPYIVLTYASNSAPNAPTLNSPVAGALVASQTPTLNFTPSDPDGNTHTEYTYQLDDNLDFSSPFESTTVAGSFPNGSPVNRVVTTTLSRGTIYGWRVATKDASLYGPYAASTSFKIGSLPSATVLIPAAGHTAQLWYLAGTSTDPKIKVSWSFSCPDGHAQTHSRVYIYADSGGSPGSVLYDTNWVANTAASYDTVYAVANGTKYHVSVQVRCSLTLESAESTKNITRVRWGRASYYFDGTTIPLSLSVASSTVIATNEEMVLEYTTTASTAEPGTWYSNVASAGLHRYFWHRVTAWGYGSGTPTTPKLQDLTWTYSASGLSLDNWTMASGAAVDTGSFVFGSQSLRHNTNAAAQRSYQIVNLGSGPDRTLVLSGRMKISGNPAAKIRVMSADGSTELASADGPTATTDWARYRSLTFQSGSESSFRVECYTSSAAGATAWFDALMFEESLVANPWIPGFIGGAVTLDSGTIGVDASKGGFLRLRGSAAGATEVVELGAHGLVMDGDTWRDPTLVNSWVNYGSVYNDAGYRKDASGFVHLKGLIKSGSVPSTAFTLPVGYRPVAAGLFVVASNDAMGRVDVSTAGVVSVVAPSSTTYVSLDSIAFLAEG